MVQVLLLVLGTLFWLSNHFVTAFKITGATGGIDARTNTLPSRLEINRFATSGAAFDLYVLSLQKLQSINQTDSLSYFQIAGIHGFPSIPWNGVRGHGPLPGYCMHYTTAFPLWHRPYLALFEQMIWTHAQSIAATYPPHQRDQYQTAASTLRIPYWDWAIYPALPIVFTNSTIFVNGPSGWHEIKNPLYRYDFHPGPEGNGFPATNGFSNIRYTTRHPLDDQLNSSDESAASQAMQSNAANMLSTTYQLLASVSNFSAFATAGWSQNANHAKNVEQIHNDVHRLIGGDSRHGSMYWPEIAAFDPIFWLHHAQLDRLVALWQALNPSSYIVPFTNYIGSYYEAVGTTDSSDTVLAPFHSNDASTFHTAGSVRDMRMFGYTYPELATAGVTGTVPMDILRSTINKLYNPAVMQAKTPRSKRERRLAESSIDAFSHVTVRTAQDLEVNNLEIQWSICIEAERFSSAAAVSIYFFMGRPPTDASVWVRAANIIGSYGQFVTADSSLSEDDTSRKMRLTGEVSLTHTIAAGVARGYLDDMTPDTVIPVLQHQLQWTAKGRYSREVCIDEVSGLKISVRSRKVKPSHELSEFPEYGRYETHLVWTRTSGSWQRV